MSRTALYVRVSTKGQTLENQLQELRAACKRNGWHVVRVFSDFGISGAKGRAARKGLSELMTAVARREIDRLAIWSIDRLGRSLRDLINVLEELKQKGVELYVDRQGIDTSTAAGKALFQMLGIFAEFEREIIRERIIAGQQRARAEGKRVGRHTIIDDELAFRAHQLRAKGHSVRAIARSLDIGVGTVVKALARSRSENVPTLPLLTY